MLNLMADREQGGGGWEGRVSGRHPAVTIDESVILTSQKVQQHPQVAGPGEIDKLPAVTLPSGGRARSFLPPTSGKSHQPVALSN